MQNKAETLSCCIKGAINEMRACAWLMEQKYEVFRNVAPTGKGDMVAWRKGESPIVIDVKSGGGESKVKGVRTITVKGNEISWKN